MRRISLALALLGAVAAAGCGGAGNAGSSSTTGTDGSRSVAAGVVTVTVQNGQNSPAGRNELKIVGGRVTSSPAGIDCGVDAAGVALPIAGCTASFPQGVAITLTATAASSVADPAYSSTTTVGAPGFVGYQFWGWAGDCAGDSTCVFPATNLADKYLVASFGGQRTNHPNFTDGKVHGPLASSTGVPFMACSACHGASYQGVGNAVSCNLCHNSEGYAATAATGLNVTFDTVSLATNAFVKFKLTDDAGKLVDVTGLYLDPSQGGTTSWSTKKNMPMAITMALTYFATDASGNVLPYKSATNGNPGTISAWATINNNTITSGTLPSATSYQYAAGQLTQGATVCTVAAPCACSSANPCRYAGTVGSQGGRACTPAYPCTCTSAKLCGPPLAATNAPNALTFDRTTGLYTFTFNANVTLPVNSGATAALQDGALWIATVRQEDVINYFNDKTFTAKNVDYAFRSFDANPPTSRRIVDPANCNKCHDGFPADPNSTGTGWDSFHSGARIYGAYCNVCHYDNRSNNADSRVFVHRIHAAEQVELPANLWFHSIGVTYPQDVRNCRQCHPDTAQGNQYKTRPNRTACGSCHYAVNFATGVGHNPLGLHGVAANLPQADDTQCATCHLPQYIDHGHLPVTPPDPLNSYVALAVTTGTAGRGYSQGSGGSLVYCTTAAPCTCGNTTATQCNVVGASANLNAASILGAGADPTGIATAVTWVIGEVTRDASKRPTISFKFQANGADVVFEPCGAGSVATTSELMAGFVGSPSVYWVWAAPQDGITAPADFNASTSAYIRTVCRNNSTSAGANQVITGPDASGFYTITILNVVVSDAAVMLTGGVGYSYSLTSTQPLTEIDLAAYPYDAATKTGGLMVPAPNVSKVATGYTPRRAVVANANCNNCHAQLGVKPTYHAGQRNDAPTCSWCHTPNRTSSGWSANAKDFLHAIHGAKKRSVPDNWHAVCPPGTMFSATANGTLGVPPACLDVDTLTSVTPSPWYAGVEYPGSKCVDCHLPNTYDFSANLGAVSNLLPSTVATGTFTPAISNSPYVTADGVTSYGSGFSYTTSSGATTQATGATLVTSPITAACFACHDTTKAKTHMTNFGGKIYQPRSGGLGTETCLTCHGSTGFAPIQQVHR